MISRTDWLNGWHPNDLGGTTVLIGTISHCVACGHPLGLICVAMIDGQVFPDELPDWPFDEDDCPVCTLRRELWEARDAYEELEKEWPRGKRRPLP